jgi:hypothetical protein
MIENPDEDDYPGRGPHDLALKARRKVGRPDTGVLDPIIRVGGNLKSRKFLASDCIMANQAVRVDHT